jgi:hypothetical protein
MIASEQQAEDIGKAITGGTRPKDFTVYQYEHRPSRLTAFGVKLPNGRRITADPRAAAPRNQNGE